MSAIGFEFIEQLLSKLDFSRGRQRIVRDKVFEKINKQQDVISLDELDLVAGGLNSDALENFNEPENKD